MEVYIPRVSSKNLEYRIFKDIEFFLILTDRLVKRGPVDVLKILTKRIVIPVPVLANLFGILKEACFRYGPPPDCQQGQLPRNIAESATDGRLILSSWQGERKKIKTLIEKNTELFKRLWMAHKDCLEGQLKIMHLEKEVSAAYFEYDLDKTDRRLKRLNKLRNVLRQIESEHRRHIQSFEHLRSKQTKVDGKLEQKTSRLEEEIVYRLQDRLTLALRKLQFVANIDREAFEFDAEKISRNLYKVTSKFYSWVPVSADTKETGYDFDIEEPVYACSAFSEFVATLPSYQIYGDNGQRRFATEQIKPASTFDLCLRKGVRIEMKLQSRDLTKGFGWSKTVFFLPRRWGFFPIAPTTE